MLPASSSTVGWLVFALLAVVALVALFDEQQLAPAEEKPSHQTTALATTSDLADNPPRENFPWDSFQVVSQMSANEVKAKRCRSTKQTRKHLTSRL